MDRGPSPRREKKNNMENKITNGISTTLRTSPWFRLALPCSRNVIVRFKGQNDVFTHHFDKEPGENVRKGNARLKKNLDGDWTDMMLADQSDFFTASRAR